MTLAHALGRTLVQSGVRHGFGVVGSGNFHLSRAFADAGGTFTAARHEGGAATMADAYARTSGEVAMLSVHQGCGYTNAITGIAEAAKSRTPLVVLAPAATEPNSNFYVDQAAIAGAVGAVERTLTDPATAVAELTGAVEHAQRERRTVVVNLPVSLLAEPDPRSAPPAAAAPPRVPVPAREDLERFRDALHASRRPVFIAGRGARGARTELLALAERTGALVATSAVAAGLFSGEEWNLGISGGFSSPDAAELISEADLIVGWGCALNMWTMRHGRLIGETAHVVQVDDTPAALGAHRQIDLGVHGDVAVTAARLLDLIEEPSEPGAGYRTPEVKQRLGSAGWSRLPFPDASEATRIDPRTLTRKLDSMLPQPRVVGVDSGNFMGYPAAFFDHYDERSLCFTQAFQSIGLGLATAIGAAIAAPDRLAIAAVGDGGAAMSLAELETIPRLGLAMVVIVYNDSAYSAEVHHFVGENHDQVQFPDVDFARVAAGLGFDTLTVRTSTDLAPVQQWLGERNRPLLIDAKITSSEPAWWLGEAFGH